MESNQRRRQSLCPFTASLTTYLGGRQIWVTREIEDSTFDRVVALYEEGLNRKEIRTELGISRTQVYRHLKRARTEGRISNEDENEDKE